MGKGYSVAEARDEATGAILRDEDNIPVPDSDFIGLKRRYLAFRQVTSRKGASWQGGRIQDVIDHENLDLKPRRLSARAVELRRAIEENGYFYLSDVADVVTDQIDLSLAENFAKEWRLVEGTSIRAVEGTVVPHLPVKAWRVIEAKQKKVFHLKNNDIIVGLVRPERRNIGLLVDESHDLIGTPDGVAVVRIRPNRHRITQEYLFAALRSEECRIQLWTESGGTSYGKLKDSHINDLMISLPSLAKKKQTHDAVAKWRDASKAATMHWGAIGSDEDRVPIINSPILGLESGAD